MSVDDTGMNLSVPGRRLSSPVLNHPDAGWRLARLAAQLIAPGMDDGRSPTSIQAGMDWAEQIIAEADLRIARREGRAP